MPVKAPLLPPHFDGARILEPEFWIGFWRRMTENALSSMIQIGGIIIAYLLLRTVLYRLIDGVLSRIVAREDRLGISEERAGRLQTLQGLSKSLVGYVLFFVFGILFLKAVGFDIMPFITTAGVIGLAIGFGAQKLVKDVISGFFIIIDNLFVVGETVTIGTITAQVHEMGMRVTKLLDMSGRTYIIANGDIGTVINLSRRPVEDFIDINVAAAADLNKVLTILAACGEQVFGLPGHHLKAAPHVIGITAFSAASVTIRVSVVSDPRELPNEQMRVREAARAALLAADIALS